MTMDVSRRDTQKVSGPQECAGCGKKIADRFLLKALDMYWHEDCLKCGCCDCRLGEVGSTLFTKANLILCKRDYLRLFGATGYCAACNKVIPAFEMVMRAKSNVYHLECFACQQCNHRFCVGDRFYLWDNKILCEYDYEERLVFANIPFQPGGGIQGPPPSVDALKQQQIASGIHPSNNQGMLGQQRNNSSQQQMCPVSSYQGQMPVHHPQGQMGLGNGMPSIYSSSPMQNNLRPGNNVKAEPPANVDPGGGKYYLNLSHSSNSVNGIDVQHSQNVDDQQHIPTSNDPANAGRNANSNICNGAFTQNGSPSAGAASAAIANREPSPHQQHLVPIIQKTSN